MSIVAWQGWRLELPSRWNPVKLEGDYHTGYLMLADLHRPRLGIRWRTLRRRRKLDIAAHTRDLMKQEVGTLAAAEAANWPMAADQWPSSLLYLEPEPPGRDVWIGFSAASHRVLQLIHFARHRERVLAESVLPSLQEMPLDRPVPWSIFELSCIVPAGMVLDAQRLNAGDLNLAFIKPAASAWRPRTVLTLRQVAVATLALQRMPLAKWLNQQEKVRQKHYRPVGAAAEIELSGEGAGRSLSGLMRRMVRRRRFAWMRWIAPQITSMALHDQQRDRLILLQGTDEQSLRDVAPTVGWAASADKPR